MNSRTSGNGGTVSRRVVEAVEYLHLRVGNLTAPPKTSSRCLPPLRDLLAQQQRAG